MKRILSGFATLALLAAVLMLTPAGSQAQNTVKNYFTGCSGVNCDNVFHPTGSIASGTSAAPIAAANADNQVAMYRDAQATSGDTRLMYLRQFFSGTGGSGETLRAYSTINNKTVATGGTVNGAHVSLSADGASAHVSGAANALRTTLDMSATVGALGGTVAVQQIDSNIATGPTIPAGTAFIRFDNVGTQKLPYLFRADDADTSAMFVASSGTSAGQCAQTGGLVATKTLKIQVNGTDYWIPLCTAP